MNPCMISILKVVDHVHSLFFTLPNNNKEEESNSSNKKTSTSITSNTEKSLPTWLKSLVDKLQDGSLNCKLFIAKIIMNRSNIFMPYGKFIVDSLISLCIEMEVPFGKARQFHYFLTDICFFISELPLEEHAKDDLSVSSWSKDQINDSKCVMCV